MFNWCIFGMKMIRALYILMMLVTLNVYGQDGERDLSRLKPDPAREQIFVKFLAARHGGMDALMTWKASNTVQYYRELWYFCESFYVRRNVLPQGETLDEGMVDITRFDSQRKKNEEVEVPLPGFRDVLVLKPENTLIYKATY